MAPYAAYAANKRYKALLGQAPPVAYLGEAAAAECHCKPPVPAFCCAASDPFLHLAALAAAVCVPAAARAAAAVVAGASHAAMPGGRVPQL